MNLFVWARNFPAAAMLALVFTLNASGALTTWDPQADSGSEPGNGVWEDALWSTSTTYVGQSPTTNWVDGTGAFFAAGTDANTPPFTVTMNATHTVAGVFNGIQSRTPCVVSIVGPGPLLMPTNTQQGFYVASNGITTIATPIGGSNTTLVFEGGGHHYYFATNFYTGGTYVGFKGLQFTGFVGFNNSYTFGTGYILFSNAANVTFAAEGDAAINITNAVTNIETAAQRITLAANAPGLTFSGPWNLSGGTHVVGEMTLDVEGLVTLSGIVSGTNGLVKTDTGTLVLSGANSYGTANTASGNTLVYGGTLLAANTTGSATGVSDVTVVSGAMLAGSGTLSGTVNNSGVISGTNLNGGAATLTTGAETWNSGASYLWNLADNGVSEIVVNGTLTLAGPVSVKLQSLTANFNAAKDASWLIIHTTSASITGFSPSAVTIDASGFTDSLGSGSFSLSTNGGDLYLNFLHAPVLTLADVSVMAGSNAVFSAVNMIFGGATAPPVYSWQSNNVPLADGGRISGSSTPNLTIANAQVSDDATYSITASNAVGFGTASATLMVQAGATTVTWPVPAPITYGAPLGASQLDATANIPGNFVYTPTAGTVLNTGTTTLSTVFTPSNTALYASATNTVTIAVAPAPLTITASNATRPYGVPNPAFTGSIAGLQNGDAITATFSSSATQSSIPGKYPIVPTPVDPNHRLTNYTVTLVNGTLNVGTALAWNDPAAITYGTPLGSNQFNASADVPGNFVYNEAPGTVLDVGAYILTVVFTPTDTTGYQIKGTNVTLTVVPAPLSITADNTTRQAGIANPVFTGAIIGAQNNDNLSANYTTSATSASPPGVYSIVPTLVDPNNRQTNYIVSLTNGALTITAPPPPITVNTPNIIPLPVTVSNRAGIFTLCPSRPSHALTRILADPASRPTAQYLAAFLAKSTGCDFAIEISNATNAVKNTILITTANAVASLGPESYELTVAPDSVVIRASAQGGAFYGAQTFLQLLPPQIYSSVVVTNVPWVAPCIYIMDFPRFSWRGAMLDVSRHFFNKDEVKQFLDAMAMHKLNMFHWHLVDDQGWRFQLTNYPNLTVTGAYRQSMDYGLPPRATTATNAAGQYGGFYTQDDARDIVAYAAQRHITIVPEIEMPCHSTCALASYPQFGCGNAASAYNMDYPNINYGVDLYSLGTPGTLDFLKDALTEVMGVFPGKYIHCGGDEVVSSGDKQWNSYNADVTNMAAIGIAVNGTNSITKYQHWLSTNLASFLQSKGRMMIGWTEFENGGVITNAALMDWEQASSNVAMSVAEAGMPVVVTLNTTLYVNNFETSNPAIEPPSSSGVIPLGTVYGFNPVFTNLPAQYTSNVLGAQCSLWGENVPSFRNAMYKMFPRETALAETTWTPLAKQNYSSFTNRLVVEEQRYRAMGLNYNHETIPQIGSWGPSVSTSPTTVNYDVTTNVVAGENDVNFWYTTGADRLDIDSVTLLENGNPVDTDVHAGYTGSTQSYPIYIVHLPEVRPGATYTIQAVIHAYGGTASSGVVYMPNWD